MTTGVDRNTDFRELVAFFRDTLLAATANRHLRDDLVPSDEGQEFGWVVYEREYMYAAVDEIRCQRGLPRLPLEAVKAVEQQAVGHSDYVAQFAYGCARLVQGDGQ